MRERGIFCKKAAAPRARRLSCSSFFLLRGVVRVCRRYPACGYSSTRRLVSSPVGTQCRLWQPPRDGGSLCESASIVGIDVSLLR